MAERGEGEEIAPRGNDWEVVSLTASAYAADPGPKAVEEIVGDKQSTYEEDKVETSQSQAMFMSGHFVFPVKQPKDVLVGPEVDNFEVPKEHKVEELGSVQTSDGIDGSVDDDEDKRGLALTVDNLEADDGLEGKDNAIGTGSAEVQVSTTQSAPGIVEPRQSIHDSSLETDGTASKQVKDKKKVRPSVPCGPWWKKQAASLYDHVKEANPLWPIVIAAAVMGLAVLGQRWQQRKSYVSGLNLHFSAKEEKPGKMLGPISRLKEAFVTANQGTTSVRSNISSEI
ncbi:unnamed protein product [Rhodiola kirilowii]